MNTLATVDLRFALTADEIVRSWRDRARRFRSGKVRSDSPKGQDQAADYRGLFGALLERSYELCLIDPQVRADAVEVTRQTGAAGGFRTQLRRKDGKIRSVEFSSQLLPGDELLLTIVRDVTERQS